MKNAALNPKQIINSHPDLQSEQNSPQRDAVTTFLPPKQLVEIAEKMMQYCDPRDTSEINEDNQNTKPDIKKTVLRGFTISHCYFAAQVHLYCVEGINSITLQSASRLLHQVCHSKNFQSVVTEDVYYNHILSVRDTILYFIKGDQEFKNIDDLTKLIKSSKDSDFLDENEAKKASYARKLINGKLQLGVPQREGHSGPRSPRKKAHADDDAFIKAAAQLAERPIMSEASKRLLENQQNKPNQKLRKQSSAPIKQDQSASDVGMLREEDLRTEVRNFCKNNNSSPIVDKFLTAHPCDMALKPALILRHIKAITGAIAKQNNPSIVKTNTYPISQLLDWLLQFKKLDELLAKLLLTQMVTGFSYSLFDDIKNKQSNDVALDSSTKSVVIKINNLPANRLTILLPNTLFNALCEWRDSSISNIKVYYRKVKNQLLSNENPPKAHLSQWSNSACQILNTLRPIDQKIISGNVPFTYGSEIHYTHIDQGILNSNFQDSIRNFKQRYIASNIETSDLESWLAFSDQLTNQDIFERDTIESDISLYRSITNNNRACFKSAKKQEKSPALVDQIESLVLQFNCITINLVLFYQVCFTCRDHWHRLKITETETGFLIQDKDSKDHIEQRFISPFPIADHQKKNTPLHQQWSYAERLLEAIRKFSKRNGYQAEISTFNPNVLRFIQFHKGMFTTSILTNPDAQEFMQNHLHVNFDDHVRKNAQPKLNRIRHIVASQHPELISSPLYPLSKQAQRSLLGHYQPGLTPNTPHDGGYLNIADEQSKWVSSLLDHLKLKPLIVRGS